PPSHHPPTQPPIQPTTTPPTQPATQPPIQTATQPSIQTATRTPIQNTTQPSIQTATHRPNPSRDRKGAWRTPALLLILLLAKLIMIWAHPAPLTAWSLLAYTWQDACVALAFAACE